MRTQNSLSQRNRVLAPEKVCSTTTSLIVGLSVVHFIDHPKIILNFQTNSWRLEALGESELIEELTEYLF
jgi:hypothetical protein